jgi:hypothetical protein
VLKAVSERAQPYEKIGGFNLPLRETILLQRCERNYSAATLPKKSWKVLTYRRAKLFC